MISFKEGHIPRLTTLPWAPVVSQMTNIVTTQVHTQTIKATQVQKKTVTEKQNILNEIAKDRNEIGAEADIIVVPGTQRVTPLEDVVDVGVLTQREYLTVVTPTVDKAGVCPMVAYNLANICVEQCVSDSDCKDTQKCCSNNCGHTCVEPSKPGTSSQPYIQPVLCLSCLFPVVYNLAFVASIFQLPLITSGMTTYNVIWPISEDNQMIMDLCRELR